MDVVIQIRYVKHHQKINDLYRMLEECRVDDKLIQLLVTLSPKTDLSPRGFITLLMLTHDLVS
jgi:fused-like protein